MNIFHLQMIGNAVPVNLAYEIANKIKKDLMHYGYNSFRVEPHVFINFYKTLSMKNTLLCLNLWIFSTKFFRY